MGDHDCIQEKELGALRSSVDRFSHELFDGPEGLVKQIPALVVKIQTLNDSIDDLKKALDQKHENSWRTLTNVLVGIGVVASVVFGIINLSRNSNIEKRQDKSDRDLDEAIYRLENKSTIRGNSVPFDSLIKVN